MMTPLLTAVLIMLFGVRLGASSKFHHLGCYRDKKSRALFMGPAETDGADITVEECYRWCHDNGRPLFALQHGHGYKGECRCGSALSAATKYGEANNCKSGVGGPWANDLYQDGPRLSCQGKCNVTAYSDCIVHKPHCGANCEYLPEGVDLDDNTCAKNRQLGGYSHNHCETVKAGSLEWVNMGSEPNCFYGRNGDNSLVDAINVDGGCYFQLARGIDGKDPFTKLFKPGFHGLYETYDVGAEGPLNSDSPDRLYDNPLSIKMMCPESVALRTSTEEVNGQERTIEWVKVSECMEGTGYRLVHDIDPELRKQAVMVRIMPSDEFPGYPQTADYVVTTKYMSDPVIAFRRGYTMTFTIDTRTSKVLESGNTADWTGKNAHSLMWNACGNKRGRKPPKLADGNVYHACANQRGIHILPGYCKWHWNENIGHDITVWMGLDVNGVSGDMAVADDLAMESAPESVGGATTFSDHIPIILGAATGAMVIAGLVAVGVAMRKKSATKETEIEMKAVHVPDESVATKTNTEMEEENQAETGKEVVAGPEPDVVAVTAE